MLRSRTSRPAAHLDDGTIRLGKPIRVRGLLKVGIPTYESGWAIHRLGLMIGSPSLAIAVVLNDIHLLKGR